MAQPGRNFAKTSTLGGGSAGQEAKAPTHASRSMVNKTNTLAGGTEGQAPRPTTHMSRSVIGQKTSVYSPASADKAPTGKFAGGKISSQSQMNKASSHVAPLLLVLRISKAAASLSFRGCGEC